MKNTPTKLFDLQYWVNGKHKETPVIGKPKPICYSQKNKLSQTTHTLGEFKIVPHV